MTTIWAHASARRWGETWVQKYQDSPTIGHTGGRDGNNPYRAQTCARVSERGWSLGLLSSVFSPPPLNEEKEVSFT